MGIITFIIVIIIFVYDPNGKYLGVYNDSITIEYIVDERCEYIVDLDGDSLFLSEKEEKEKSVVWKFLPNSDGVAIIKFTCNEGGGSKSVYLVKYELKVFKNKIYWIKGEAVGITDFPNPE